MKGLLNLSNQINFLKLVICSLVFSSTVLAKEKKWENTLTGGSIVTNATCAAQDAEIAGTGVNYILAESLTFVELKIDDFTGPFDHYQYTVNLTVTPITNTGVVGTPYNISLRIENNRVGGLGNFIDLQKHQVLNSRGASVKVVSISNYNFATGATSATTPANVSLNVSYQTKRFYTFDTSSAPSLTFSSSTPTNETIVRWLEVPGAEDYELAWTWVDNYSATFATALLTGEIPLSVREFENNCTRIQTQGREYRLPMVYDNGYLVFRIRAIGRFPQDVSKRMYGRWDITPVPTEPLQTVKVSNWLTNARATAPHTSFALKNWQFQTSYAEGGKKKDVVSYFDGSLRNRQTVTRTTTNSKTIVGEVIYDEEGRPAIEVLPVPFSGASNGLKYYENFNKNTGNKVYSYQDFARNPNDFCNLSALGMHTNSGAGNYYSAAAAATGTNQDFVPISGVTATGTFPFSQTEYSLDNTGRVKRKGGVGTSHKIGSQHEMKYFYSVPTQEELNRLFGYNVGLASHYKKNTVIDPNKQVSVSYLDPQGRTIATALSANTPTGIEPLEDNSDALNPTNTIDLLNKLSADAVDTDQDNNYKTSSGYYGNLLDRLTYSAQKVFVEESTSYTFKYDIQNANVFTQSCGPTNYTYPFIYNLSRKIVDDCGVPVANVPAMSQVGTYSVTNGIVNPGSATALAQSLRDFTVAIPPGAYQISKELTVDGAALDIFANDYIKRGVLAGCILGPQPPNATIDGCFKTCESCVTYYNNLVFKSEQGTTYAAGKISYVKMMLSSNHEFLSDPTGTAEELFTARFEREFDLLIIACNEPCKRDGLVLGGTAGTMSSMNCDNSLDLLLSDMMPNGQYGVYKSDVDDQGNIISGDNLAINQLPLTVYNDQMEEDEDVVANQVHAAGALVDPNTVNWRNPRYYNTGLLINPTTEESKHYYTASGQIDYVTIKWDAVNNTFNPALIATLNKPSLLTASNSTLVLDAEAGLYKVEPHYLAHVEDFIAFLSSRPSWAMSLVRYHPEFHYLDYIYKTCGVTKTTNAAFNVDTSTPAKETVTLNSDGLDSFLGSYKTYAEALSAGLLDSALTIYNADPFFHIDHPLDGTIISGLTNAAPAVSASLFRAQKQSIMKNALVVATSPETDPNNTSGTASTGRYENTGLVMANYIYRTIKCNGLDYNCSPQVGNTFADVMVQVNSNNFTTEEKDLFWQYYVSYYIGLKQKIQHVYVNLHALRQGFYNDCIGNNNSQNTNIITEVINKYSKQRNDYINPWIHAPNVTLYSENGQLLADKEKRFLPFDEVYDSEKTDAEIYKDMLEEANSHYLATSGNCPRVNDLAIFLDNFMRAIPMKNVIAASATNVTFTGGYLTPDLFKAIGGLYAQNTPAGNFQPTPGALKVNGSLSTDKKKLTIQFAQTTVYPNPAVTMSNMVLTIPATPATVKWDTYNNDPAVTTATWRIMQISQLSHTTKVGDIYNYSFIARIHWNNQPAGSFIEVVMTGTTKAVLTCSTDPIVASNNGSVFVPRPDDESCTKKEDFAKALKDLIISLGSDVNNATANGYSLVNNQVYKNGYLDEYFGSENSNFISWKREINSSGWFFNDYVFNNSPVYTIRIGENANQSIIAFMLVVSQQVNSSGLQSITIGELFDYNNSYGPWTSSELANIVTLKYANGTQSLGKVGAGNGKLEFACCIERDSTEEELVVDDFFELTKQLYNEIIAYCVQKGPNHPDYANGYHSPTVTALSNYYTNLDFGIYNLSYAYDTDSQNWGIFFETGSGCFNHNVLYSGIPFDNVKVAKVVTGGWGPSYGLIINGISVLYGTVVYESPNGGYQSSGFFRSGCIKSFFYVPSCPCTPKIPIKASCTDAYAQYEEHLHNFKISNTLPQLGNPEVQFNFSGYQVFCGLNYATIWEGYSAYLNFLNITNTEHPNYITLPEFGATALNYGYDNYLDVIQQYIAYLALGKPMYLGTNSVYYDELGDVPENIDAEKIDTWAEYAAFYVFTNNICPPTPLVPTIPIRFIKNNNCIDYSKAVNEAYNADAYEAYINALKEKFKKEYLKNALALANEKFTFDFKEKEYQYTLYYYDQAGNLLQTVAPEGVNRLNFVANTSLNTTINSHRYTAAGQVTENASLLPAHNFKTQYRYNSLNQLVWQSTPDGGETRFAYDKLGRIVASQNANQGNFLNNTPLTLDTGLIRLPDGAITKTTNNSTWLGGNTSSNVIGSTISSQGGYVQYTFKTDASNALVNNLIMIGLSYANSSTVTSIRYGFYVVNATTVYIRQNTTNTTTGVTLIDGDVLRIERIGGIVKWFKNSQLLLSVSEASPTASMLVDLAIGRFESKIQDLKIQNYDLNSKFSYTRYDALGRIKEAGEFLTRTPRGINDNGRLVDIPSGEEVGVDAIENNYPFNVSQSQTQVTKTLYDTYEPFVANNYLSPQTVRNIRSRVTAILTFPATTISTPLTAYETAIFYNYDIHGNVDEMVQGLGTNIIALSPTPTPILKRVNYEYDLISGNVNKVIYQKNSTDQFIHKYNYDADNRITDVQTSKDNVIWEKDASYEYYDHGPLSRVVLGDKQVQGIDYAYTLHGWLKTVNSENLATQNRDMGKDGNRVSKDAFGYSLAYYENDYTARKPSATPHGVSASSTSYAGTDLYNGNIKRMITSVRSVDESILPTQVNLYKYDQLNRIFSMNSFSVKEASGSFTSAASYGSSYLYDRNGNLKTLNRSAPKIVYSDIEAIIPMDNFTYSYTPTTNRLRHIKDAVAAGDFVSPATDIDSQPDDNYRYDAIGQLVSDSSENIENIIWRVDGKVHSVVKTSGTTITFYYDGLGNRVAKQVQGTGVNDITHYARDAQGNTLGVYDFKGAGTPTYTLKEHHIYGSNRLGMQTYIPYAAPSNFHRVVGDKKYELSNHLGNVVSVVNDRKIVDSGLTVRYYDSFDTSIGTWEPVPASTSIGLSQKMLVVGGGSLGDGVTKYINVDVNDTYAFQFSIISNPVGIPVRLDIMTTSNQVLYTQRVRDGLNMINYVAPLTGTLRIAIVFDYTQGGSSFYIDEFYAYRIPRTSTDFSTTFVPDVESYNDYYPFGMLVPRRNSSDNYRYGFQGQEKDDEIKGDKGNSLNYTFRMHDPRVGRFFAVDPLASKYPHNSTYAFSENRVIDGVELEGLEFDKYRMDYGVKINFQLDNSIKIKATLYTAITNDKHGFGVNLVNNNGSMIINAAYVPKINFNISSNNNKINLTGNVAGNPFNLSVSNPSSNLLLTPKPENDIIDNFGAGVGYNFFKKKMSFGLVNQKLETSLKAPADSFSGAMPIATFFPKNVIESTSGDLNIKAVKLPFLEKSLTIDFGEPQISNDEREEKFRTSDKKTQDKQDIEKDPLINQLNIKVKGMSKDKSKKIAPIVKLITDAIKS